VTYESTKTRRWGRKVTDYPRRPPRRPAGHGPARVAL